MYHVIYIAILLCTSQCGQLQCEYSITCAIENIPRCMHVQLQKCQHMH